MLTIGVIFRNLPGDIFAGYDHAVEVRVKAFGLATIMMRAGLKVRPGYRVGA